MNTAPAMLELEATAKALGQELPRLRRWLRQGLLTPDARLHRRPLFLAERIRAIRKALERKGSK